MNKTMFRSTTGAPVHVALTTGHSTVIPPAGKAIHSRFHRRAVALGCLPVNADTYQAPEADDFDRAGEIRKGLYKMLESNDPKAFTANNQPNMNTLSGLIGFRVERSEVAPIWDQVEAELGD